MSQTVAHCEVIAYLDFSQCIGVLVHYNGHVVNFVVTYLDSITSSGGQRVRASMCFWVCVYVFCHVALSASARLRLISLDFAK